MEALIITIQRVKTNVKKSEMQGSVVSEANNAKAVWGYAAAHGGGTMPRQKMKHSLTLLANKRFLLFNEQLV